MWGFTSESGRISDFNVNIIAESLMDATEAVLKQYSSLVVSKVCRANKEILLEYRAG